MDQNLAPQVPNSPVSPPPPIPAPSIPVGPSVVVSSVVSSVPVTVPNVVVAPVTTQNTVQVPYAPPMPNSNYNYAGFFRRYFATLIDLFLITFINTFIIAGFTVLSTFIIGGEGLMRGRSLSETQAGMISLAQLPGFIICQLINTLYYVLMIGKRGQTLGKMALGIKVIKTDGNTRVGYLSAFLREIIGKIVSAMIFGLGYLWMLWDSKKQTWHDKIAKTIVIRV